MASSIAAALVILMVVAAPAVHGVQHIVGGNSQWSLSGNYVNWAASQTFIVGDTLLFEYDSSHQVDVLDQADYNSCSFGNSISNYNNGNSSIPLTKSGPWYFACPISTHCANGMKLEVNVLASTSGPTGSPPGSPPTTPSTTSPPPPPPKSGGASVVCDMKMLGVTALLAAVLIAFMG